MTDLFNVLESKVEEVLRQIERLREANVALQQSLAEKEQAFKEATATLENFSREREAVRQRIDKILNRLKILDIGETA